MNDTSTPPSAVRTLHSRILYLFTRTPLHVGAGTSVGAVDQPVQRERHTGFPVVPGSAVKGVLADHFLTPDRKARTKEGRDIFGHEDPKAKDAQAGKLSFGEARLLAFPVRSARGSFAFITCPLALERFQRERGDLAALAPVQEPADMHCLAGGQVGLPAAKPTGVVLEEYKFALDAPFPPEWEATLLSLLSDDPVWQVGKGRFVLLNNGDFSHFVRNACEIGQHVRISDATGTAEKGGLFDLEAVPAETLFFAPITSLSRANGELKQLGDLLDNKCVLQFGGDGTTGLGFCTVKLG